MSKKTILCVGTIVVILCAMVFLILLNTKHEKTESLKTITDTYQGYSISIPTDWNVFVANPEKVQARLDEYKKTPHATPESLYGYNEPEYTSEVIVRGYNSAFQKGTSTVFQHGGYGTTYIILNTDEEQSDIDKSIEDFDKYVIKSYEEKAVSSGVFTIVKKSLDREKAYWLVKKDYDNDGKANNFVGYIKFGNKIFVLNAGHINYSEFEKIALSIKSI